MSTGISDDYAHGEFGRYHFYYGYEKTICPDHGNDSDCECDEKVWAFVVTDNGKEIGRATAKQLGEKQFDEPVEILLKGIAKYGKAVSG